MNRVMALGLMMTAILSCSCTPSYIYSPSVNLPPEPLEQKQIQFMAGYGVMPEARTDKTGDDTAEAAEATLRVGATDWLWLQVKGWWDLSGKFDEIRQGYSFSPTLTLMRDYHGFDFGLMPAGVLVMDSSDPQGGGFTLSGCVWMPKAGVFHLYSAVGAGYGMRYDDGVGDRWGWVVTANFGVAVLLADRLTLNFETSAIHQYNHYDDRTDRFMVPTLNVGIVH